MSDLMRPLSQDSKEKASRTYWILPWDPKKFDLTGCLEAFGHVEWRQINKLVPGDYVFLYCTKPIGQILYMLKVTDINIPKKIANKDWYFKTEKWDIKEADYYARFYPISVTTMSNHALSHEVLVKMGMKKKLQMGMRATGILLDHILKNFDVTLDNSSEEFIEGASHQSTVTSYERNPFARQKCLNKYGYSCQLCGFNFEDTYGEFGKEFIHVHHIEFISSHKGKKHNVNAIADLIPVCPNCHAMLHRRWNGKYLSPDELKSLLEE